MSETEQADTYLGVRNLTDWSDLELNEKVGFLAQAGDYILATYTFTIEEPETRDAYRSAKFWLAYQLSKSNGLAVAHSDPIKSQERSLEGLTSNKTTYEVITSSDPYPLVTKMLRPIIAQTGGFQIVGVTK